VNGSSSTAFLRFALVLQLLVLFAAKSSATGPAITSLSPTSGAIGTSVTITGTNFGSPQGGSTVTFNGTSASVSTWSLTSIVATVPSGATTGNVVVTVSGLASNGMSFTVTPLPSGWTDGDIGSVGQAGSASFNFGTFVVKGAGLGLNSNDGINFVYQSLSGDGTIIARLASLTNTSTSEAGLMIRATLDPSATDFTVLNTTSADYIFYKTTPGTNSGYWSGPGALPPTWLKLVRSGNTFSGYSSPNGADWTLINSSQTITMSQNVYVGLWVSSGVTSSLATANFDNVSLTSSAATSPIITGLSATTGPAGTQVQINGSGFGASQNGSAVYLGNLAASVASWSASAITITIPTGATSGLIVVSVAPTMNDSNGVEFEITNQPLPPPWLNQDVGPTGLQGSATFTNRTFTLNGAGRAVYYNPDGFHFAYQPLSGDGSIVARVTSITGSNTQAGVMIRETLTGSSVHAFAYFQPNTATMYYRTSTGGSTSSQTVGLSSTAYPYWVRLDRSGSTFTSYVSLDGSYWLQIGSSQLITMAETAFIGLVVSSNSTSSLSTVTFDNVWVSSATAPGPTISSVSATTGSIGSQVSVYGTGFGATQGNSVATINGVTMTINSWSDTAIVFTIPSGATSGLLGVFVAPSMNASNTFMFTITTQPLAPTWLDQDIGKVGLAGSATYSNGNFTIKAAGQVIANTQDGFHFVYQPLSGDGSIIARVSNIQNASNPQIGVMIRESVQPGAENAFAYFNPNTGTLNMRVTTGGSTTQQSVGFSGPTYPYWVKLSRSGNTFTGYVSRDGTNWTQVGSQTFTMAQNTLIGLAVCNQTTSSLVTATFDSVSLSTDLLVPPVIFATSATTGPVGAQVNITGSGFGATQGASLVVLNGSPVTINSWSQSAITITIPAGATSGLLEVLLGPTMNSSNPAVFAVTTQPLPAGWLDRDIGAVGTQGSATYSGGVFTVNAVGKINGTADALHFVYQPLVGDGVLVARVTGITGGDSNAQIGIMLRETLNSNATGTFVWMYPGSSPNLSTRTTTGSNLNTQSTSFAHDVIPFWVKLARTGSTFNGYISNDGVNWTQVGTSQTISMAQLAYVGLAAANWWNNTSLLTATFDNVSITPGTMPVISGLSPNSGGIGAQVTVTGSNFGSSQGSSTLTFNGVLPTSISSWTNGQIVATVPSNASTGPVVVTVNSIGSNTNQIFSFYNPILTGVSPSVGQINSKIVLSGTGFQNDQYTGNHVQFNGHEAGILAWSDTAITVNPPYSQASGPVTVIVGGVSSNSLPFTLENLAVTGISPNSGSVGSQVTINGTGFGSSQSTSTVDFYGTIATIQSWSDTQIVAIVPAGVVSGPVDVTVGSVTWYGPVFTVTQTVQVTDSKSNQSTYTSAMVGGLWVSIAGQGSGCSTCTQRGNISYTYDAAGHPLTRTDENGNNTSYTYDSNGNVLTVTVPISSGHTATTTYTYNNFGEVLTATDPLGNVTTNTYDANGNLLSVKTPAPGNGPSGSVTQFVYDTKGELTRITDPLGNQTNIAYFPTGMIQTITDAQSHVTTYAYDTQGNRTSVTDANSKQTTFTYDAMNRLTKITYPDTTTTQFGYDIRGRRTSVTDQNSKQTTYAYDDADRLTSVTDAATNVTTYGYDTESNLTSIKDAKQNTTTFDYDAFGRVTETHFPSGQIEQYGYDNIGNLTSKTDRKNQQITYTYDQLNRLAGKTYPDTTTVNYTYDNDSRLTQVSDPTGTYQFTFDNMGRLTGTTTSYAFLTGRNFTTGYGYDAASNRTSFTDPESGSTAYVYDTLNRLQTLTPPAAISGGSFGFGYDALSRRTSLTRPNAVNTSYSYDNLSRLLNVTHAKGGVTLDGATYTLDNAGNRNSKADIYAGVTTNYGYDNIYELLSATQGASTTESYTYDPVGNRLSNLSGSGWNNNTSNELTSRPGVTYTYDNNGNTLTKTDSTGTTNYTWDFENRLTSVTLPGSGGTVSFKYDPFGRRIYKSSSSGTSNYSYDGNNLVEETNASGGVVARYSQGLNIDEPLAMLRSSTTSYYQADGLGSVTSLTNAAGAVVNNYTYDSFGNLVATSGSLVNNFRYTGREFDPETSLYFYRARYYDPQTGKFLSEDRIRFTGGENFYRYVRNGSVSLVDPFGFSPTGTGIGIGIGGVVGGIIGGAIGVGGGALGGTLVAPGVGTVGGAIGGGYGGAALGAAIGAVVGGVVGGAIGSAFNPTNPGSFPDVDNPPIDWTPHPQGGRDRYLDPEGWTWRWHPNAPPGAHPGDHWDLGSPDGDQWWWPKGGQPTPKGILPLFHGKPECAN
jgi:RHS repeat-associated protein